MLRTHPSHSLFRRESRRAPGPSRISLRVLPLLTALLLCGALPLTRSPAAADPGDPPDPQAVADREDSLLLSAFDYLQLSRSQLGILHAYGRLADQRRQAFERQEQEAMQAIDRLRETETEALERIRTALEERRSEVTAGISADAAQELVRILSREQIALAWRLTGGKPPQYAEADPALLDPAADFVDPSQTPELNELPETLLAPGVGGAESGVTPYILDLQVARSALTQNLELAPDVDLRGAMLREYRSNGLGQFQLIDEDARPFPQLVVETDDLRELLPGVSHLAERLFLSPRLVPALESAIRNGLGINGGAAHRSTATPRIRKVREYRMEQGFTDQTGNGPDVETLGGAVDHGSYVFGPGQGLRLADSGVRDQYSIEIQFQYFGGDGYQKILDFKNRTKDDGLYFYQGHLTFYTLANGGVPIPGQEHRLRLERNRNTRIVRAFLDLQPIFSFIDLDDEAVLQDGQGLLFVDDEVTKDEQGPGAVRRVTVWNAPLR